MNEKEMLFARHLAGAVRFRTISNEDRALIDESAFFGLHAYLWQIFPRVHEVLDREVVAVFSLLYRWAGTNPSLKPALLLGHLDVVPVELESEDAWSYPPFEGCIDDGYIWGRGVMDDKCAVIGILEAVEVLLEGGFQPERTLYLAFGHDEELGGRQGAAQIAAALKSQRVDFEFVLDEGLAVIDGVIPNLTKPVALVGIGEKGFVNFELSVDSPGGHSSMPPEETAVGILAAAVGRLERHPMAARDDTPSFLTFERLAKAMPPLIRFAIANRWLTSRLLIYLLSKTPATNATIRSTGATTFFQAGVKENILPTKAKAVVNYRILPGDTAQAIHDHIHKIVADSRVQVKEVGVFRSDPSPVSDIDTPGFHWVESAIQKAFPDALVAPGLVLGGTDCRHFTALSRSCFRFLPLQLKPDDLPRIHGVDERISISNYALAVEFYQELVAVSCGSGSKFNLTD